jgi:DNA-binding winged helix-turn-helix (wHTH) protein
MSPAQEWRFGPFCLDADNACLWHGTQAIALKPKTFAVLHHLVAYAGRLVTKEELSATVWPGTAIDDAVLKVCIAEIRKALGDTARTSQFIATVHRRGYRFIAPLAAIEAGEVHHAAFPLPEIPPRSHQPLDTPTGAAGTGRRCTPFAGGARAGSRRGAPGGVLRKWACTLVEEQKPAARDVD